jgi:hypothetical protein
MRDQRDRSRGLAVFVSREQSGYFIELIERSPAAADGVFTNDNMGAAGAHDGGVFSRPGT